MRAFVLALVGLLVVGVSSAGASDRNVLAQNRHFSPHRIIAVADDTVTWTNKDAIGHTVDPWITSPFGKDQSRTQLFSAQGTFQYHCQIHAGMTGTVAVYNLYFAGPPSSILHGKTAAMSGYAPEGDPVDIFQEGNVTPVASVIANPTTGRFTASIPGVPGRYRAETASPRVSAWVRVNVRPKLIVRSRHKGKAFWITVSTAPNQTGGKMVIERKNGYGWKKLGTRTLGASSKAVFRVVPTAKMQVRLRLSAPVNGYSKATSGTLTLRP